MSARIVVADLVVCVGSITAIAMMPLTHWQTAALGFIAGIFWMRLSERED